MSLRLPINRYVRKVPTFKFRFNFNGACCKNAKVPKQCNIELSNKHPVPCQIYKLSTVAKCDIPTFRCRNYTGCKTTSRKSFNPICDVTKLKLSDQDELYCSELPIVISRQTIISYSLLVFLSQKTINDPNCGPSAWKNIHLQHQKSAIIAELAQDTKCTYTWTNESLTKFARNYILSDRSYRRIWFHCYRYIWSETKKVKTMKILEIFCHLLKFAEIY